MRGLENRHTYRHTQRHTDMATLWPTRPSGAELVKINKILASLGCQTLIKEIILLLPAPWEGSAAGDRINWEPWNWKGPEIEQRPHDWILLNETGWLETGISYSSFSLTLSTMLMGTWLFPYRKLHKSDSSLRLIEATISINSTLSIWLEIKLTSNFVLNISLRCKS